MLLKLQPRRGSHRPHQAVLTALQAGGLRGKVTKVTKPDSTEGGWEACSTHSTLEKEYVLGRAVKKSDKEKPFGPPRTLSLGGQ